MILQESIQRPARISDRVLVYSNEKVYASDRRWHDCPESKTKVLSRMTLRIDHVLGKRSDRVITLHGNICRALMTKSFESEIERACIVRVMIYVYSCVIVKCLRASLNPGES